MARIDSKHFDVANKNNSVHQQVEAKYSFFNDNGVNYFELETFGSTNRENPGKQSQIIQFDEATAKVLVNLLIDKFKLKY